MSRPLSALQVAEGYSEINRDWLPLSVADERWKTSWGGKKQTKSTLRNRRACSELQF
jgi:hypothetical protein